MNVCRKAQSLMLVGVVTLALGVDPASAARRGYDNGVSSRNETNTDRAISSEQIEASRAKGGLRYRVMVTEFEDRSLCMSYGGLSISNAWHEMLTNALQEDGRFLVIAGKEERQNALEEQEFAESEASSKSRSNPRKSNLAVAQLLVKGTLMSVVDNTSSQGGRTNLLGVPLSLGKDGTEVRMIVKVYDAQSGLVIASKEITGKSSAWTIGLPVLPANSSAFFGNNENLAKAASAALKKAIDFCGEQLGRLEWTGAILSKKTDGTVLINRGEREGIVAGQTFAFGDCAVLDDPETGEFLGLEKTLLGVLRVIKTQEKYAICEVTDGAATAKTELSIWIPEQF